jgi:hypothetical protein
MPVYNSKERQEIVMADTLVLESNQPYPATEANVAKNFQTYAREWQAPAGLAAGWSDLLGQCLAEVTVYKWFSTEVVDRYRDIKFATFANLLTFLNTNLPHEDLGSGDVFTVDCVMKFYSVVDSSLPAINRIFGYNKCYSCLLGTSKNTERVSGRIRSSAVSLYDAVDPERLLDDLNHTRAAWTFNLDDARLEYFVAQAWKSVWGESMGSDVPAYNTDDTSRRNWLSSIWFQTHKGQGKIYRLPATDKGLQIFMGHQTIYDPVLAPIIPQRMTVDTAGNFVNAKFWETYEIKKFSLCSIPLDNMVNIPPSPDAFSFTVEGGEDQYRAGDGTSTVAIYGVQSGDRRALFIKPFGGPDTFMLPKFDSYLYELEMVRIGGKMNDKFSNLNLLGVRTDHSLYSYRFRKNILSTTFSKNNNYERNNVDFKYKFYIRKKGSEFVSPMSSTYITCKFQNNGQGPSAWVYQVEHDR